MTSNASSSGASPSTAISPAPEIRTLSEMPKVSTEQREEAARLKQEGNKAFISKGFPTAERLYTQAIELNPTDPVLWCNRANARIRLEEFGYALNDANQALALDPRYAKAYYRRAICYVQILKLPLAVADFRRVIALQPDSDVQAQLAATQKLHRKIEFEKAIEREGEKNAVVRCQEIIEEGQCLVDNDYKGPKLESLEDGGFGITQEFVTDMIAWFKAGHLLPRRYVWEIVLGAHRHFGAEESLVELDLQDGMTCDIIGDVHGQFYDMIHMLGLTGGPGEKHCLLMNGDLVDRGSWSVEVILTAFAFKWLYPHRMFINRGNHEAKDMNSSYGFEGEVKAKHGDQTYKLFAHVFTTLPLATLVSATQPPRSTGPMTILSPKGHKRFFVVHGGLFSKEGVTLEDIRKIERIGRQPGQEGLMCELLWTDPQEKPGRGPSKRGVGIGFGPDVTQRWCTLNEVTGIIRSHEVRQNGYEIEHGGLCTTVFSAPNYVDQAGNKAAFIRIDAAGEQEFVQFEASPHPDKRPMAYAMGGLASLLM